MVKGVASFTMKYEDYGVLCHNSCEQFISKNISGRDGYDS